MKPSEQNLKRHTNSGTQTYTRKFSCLDSENTDSVFGESSRPKILQTISEEAPSEQRASISNRSENAQNTNRIYKNHSERHLAQNQLPEFKNQTTVMNKIQSQIHDHFNPVDYYGTYEFNRFERKPPLPMSYAESYSYSKPPCYECQIYLNKITQLQNSYELLLMAKSQEVEQCKLIISGLEEKLRQIQKRSLQEIQKNKKFRSQIEKRNTQELYHRERQNQMIEYLKNREIVLLQEMKDLENQIYIKTIKTGKPFQVQKEKNSSKKLNFNSKGFSRKQNEVDFNEELSVSEYSAKTFEMQFDSDQNPQFSSGNRKIMNPKNELYASSGTRITVDLVERVPLNEILKKANQIECLKDDLLVSELKIKIEQTKSLENLLLTK